MFTFTIIILGYIGIGILQAYYFLKSKGETEESLKDFLCLVALWPIVSVLMLGDWLDETKIKIK